MEVARTRQELLTMTAKKTDDEFKLDVFNMYGIEYDVIDTYTKSCVKVLVKHNICGRYWKITPNNLLRGKTCPFCSNYKGIRGLKTDLLSKYGNHYDIVGNYKGCDVKTKFICNIHNVYFYTTPSNLLRRPYTCPKCNGEHAHTTQVKDSSDYEEQLYNSVGNTITMLEPYKGKTTKIKFRCNICSLVFITNPYPLLHGSGCPYCCMSQGERLIYGYLNSKGYSFDYQKTFNDCRYQRKLPFDFYLRDLNTLIEYDGKQHYNSIEFFGGEDSFKSQQLRDEIKNKYAIDNGITLIRIPYNYTRSELVKVIENIMMNNVSYYSRLIVNSVKQRTLIQA